MTFLSRAFKKLFNMPASSETKSAEVLGRALFIEAAKTKPDIHKMVTLIKKGADVTLRNSDGATVLIYVAGREAFSNENAMTLAVKLVEAGADINAATICDNTAGIWASRMKRDALTAWFVEHGANIYAVNHKNESIDSLSDWTSKTPFEMKKTIQAVAKIKTDRQAKVDIKKIA